MSYGQINIPNAKFKRALLNHTPVIDTNNDGEISKVEAEAATIVRVHKFRAEDIRGIENFVNVTLLHLWGNELTNIDISALTKLKILDITRNNISSLDVSKNINLIEISGADNNLRAIDIRNLSKLRKLSLPRNKLETLDLTRNVNLTNLTIQDNELNVLNIRNNVNLQSLVCKTNNIKNLDISKNSKLGTLSCDDNQLTSLDVSANRNLYSLSIGDNDITQLDLTNNTRLGTLFSNNTNLSTLDTRNCRISRLNFDNNPNITTAYITGQPLSFGISFERCPSLQFICVDADKIELIQNLSNGPNYTPVSVSSNCDGQAVNLVSGNVTYDLDNNGCSAGDIPFPNLSFGLQDASGFEFKQVFVTNSGYYATEAYEGDNFMFANFESENYFNITPDPSLTFPNPFFTTPTPADGTIEKHDFCITPIGDFDDLEVYIIPFSVATPGFNAEYVIVYKNNGTTTQSGQIGLTYQQNILTPLSKTPNVSTSSTNKYSWNFTNLRPFESRQIRVVFKLNRPTDTPAVNLGDILTHTVMVTGATDETPENNVMILNQEVINSYDPNDKICLEGETIKPEDVGKYLHYMIRFENEGTANARTITVKDDIDVTKLDIESFIPLQASHPYRAVVNNKKEVEFIFENIELPFDDANNDGYVIFKIKTKSNLKLGDRIDNKAAIFFDFNAPIITEVETVTVQEEEAPGEPEFSDYFTLTPNPTKGNLTLTPVSGTSAAIRSIHLLDIRGRILRFFPPNTRSFNLSYLFPNTYFMRVTTDKGVLTTQFIKIR